MALHSSSISNTDILRRMAGRKMAAGKSTALAADKTVHCRQALQAIRLQTAPQRKILNRLQHNMALYMDA
jgi:hypothetical protein